MNFRLTSSISTTTSAQLLGIIKSMKLRKGTSEAIRASMSKYAHKAKTLRIPKEFQPPQNYADRVSLMAVLSPVLRDEYEAHAREYGIPMSELILRCLSAWVEHQASAKENPIA